MGEKMERYKKVCELSTEKEKSINFLENSMENIYLLIIFHFTYPMIELKESKRKGRKEEGFALLTKSMAGCSGRLSSVVKFLGERFHRYG